jgi:hypothetical protein
MRAKELSGERAMARGRLSLEDVPTPLEVLQDTDLIPPDEVVGTVPAIVVT